MVDLIKKAELLSTVSMGRVPLTLLAVTLAHQLAINTVATDSLLRSIRVLYKGGTIAEANTGSNIIISRADKDLAADICLSLARKVIGSTEPVVDGVLIDTVAEAVIQIVTDWQSKQPLPHTAIFNRYKEMIVDDPWASEPPAKDPEEEALAFGSVMQELLEQTIEKGFTPMPIYNETLNVLDFVVVDDSVVLRHTDESKNIGLYGKMDESRSSLDNTVGFRIEGITNVNRGITVKEFLTKHIGRNYYDTLLELVELDTDLTDPDCDPTRYTCRGKLGQSLYEFITHREIFAILVQYKVGDDLQATPDDCPVLVPYYDKNEDILRFVKSREEHYMTADYSVDLDTFAAVSIFVTETGDTVGIKVSGISNIADQYCKAVFVPESMLKPKGWRNLSNLLVYLSTKIDTTITKFIFEHSATFSQYQFDDKLELTKLEQ